MSFIDFFVDYFIHRDEVVNIFFSQYMKNNKKYILLTFSIDYFILMDEVVNKEVNGKM